MTSLRTIIALALVSLSGVLCVVLGMIGAFGQSFGAEAGPSDHPFWVCLFYFPLPLCLVSLISLRWAAALLWINCIVLCRGYLLLQMTCLNPFGNIVSALAFSVALLNTLAFLVVANGALERKYRSRQAASLPL